MNEEPKRISELNKTEKTALILKALQKDGFNSNQSSQLLEISRARVSQVSKRLRTGGLLFPLVKKAKDSISLLLNGQPVGKMREVKGSDVLTAAKMVLDRYEPVINKTESTNVTMDFEITPENRQRYKRLLGIIDAEYEVISEPKSLPGRQE